MPNLLQQLNNYLPKYPSEKETVTKTINLITSTPNCFKRSNLTGHITGSAWIIDPLNKHVLLTLHRKLDLWLQPGGHADGEPDACKVALTEAHEETGLQKISLITPDILDVDIQQIPEHKGVPAHLHYDIRYLFKANINEPLVITSESKALQWFPFDKIHSTQAPNTFLSRMLSKTFNYI